MQPLLVVPGKDETKNVLRIKILFFSQIVECNCVNEWHFFAICYETVYGF